MLKQMEIAKEAQAAFFDRPLGRRLLAFVAEFNPVALENCFFLHHIPDQGEDYFVLIVNGEDVFEVSIDRQTGEIVLEDRELKPPQWQQGGLVVQLARQKRKELRERRARDVIDSDDQW